MITEQNIIKKFIDILMKQVKLCLKYFFITIIVLMIIGQIAFFIDPIWTDGF